MRWIVVGLVVVAGCVQGTPFDPDDDPCYWRTYYMTFDTAVTAADSSAFVTDSIVERDCGVLP